MIAADLLSSAITVAKSLEVRLKVNVMTKFIIKKAGQEESDDKLLCFVMFKEVLEKLLGSIENKTGQ